MMEICTKKAETKYLYHERNNYEKSYIVDSSGLLCNYSFFS